LHLEVVDLRQAISALIGITAVVSGQWRVNRKRLIDRDTGQAVIRCSIGRKLLNTYVDKRR